MDFKDFQKRELKGVKFRSDKDWEIFLPFKTHRETIQTIIERCRERLIIGWHIIYTEATEQNAEPEIRIYWDI